MRYFKYFFVLVLGSLSISCQKFLTKDPDLRQQVSTVDNIKDLLGSAYPTGAYMAFTEFSTDNMMQKQGVNLVTRDEYLFPFRFQDYVSVGRSSEQDMPTYYWNEAYKAIAAANKALQAIQSASLEDQKKLLPYTGEALICRAYAHFMLACFFAETYDPATAEQTEGIPYVEDVEDVAIKKYQRVNLAEVYRRIERDLLEGLPLLSDGAYVVPKYHFGVKSAYAFATRFYLHKRDWEKVIQCAEVVYPSEAAFAADIRPWGSVRYKSYTFDALNINYSKATESANLLLAATFSVYGRFADGQGIGFVNTFDGTPYAEGGILSKLFAEGVFTTFRNFFHSMIHNIIPKYREYFKRVAVNANTGTPYVMVPLFVVEEVLFNKAEAQILKGDTTNAIATLNIWAKMRIQKGFGSSGKLISSNGDLLTGAKINEVYGNKAAKRVDLFKSAGDPNADIYKTLTLLPDSSGKKGNDNLLPYLMALLDLKRIEFFFEGIRWFDLMRYRLPILHIFNGEVYPLGPNSKQRVFNVPTTVGLAGIEPTPR